MQNKIFNGQTLNWDTLSIHLQSGLDEQQVRHSAEKFGRNLLTPPPREPWWRLLLEKFDDPTIKILLVAAVISLLMTVVEKFALGHSDASFIDSVGIILAVLLATLCGFFSELKSAREFDLLNKVKDDIKIKVLRGRQIQEISIEKIVVGDVVELALGDKVPADGIVINAMGLLVDQAVMTGESVPIEKHSLALCESFKHADAANCKDANLVYRGTMIADGHGEFLVTEVGDKTRLGQIAANLGRAESDAQTPLTQKLTVLAKQISVVGISGAMMIFMVMAIQAIGRSQLFAQMFNDTIPLIGFSLAAIVGGVFIMRTLLRPFFASMDMELRDWRLQLLVTIPVIVAVFGIGLGLWGTLDTHGDFSLAMELFRSLLISFVVAVTIIVVAVPEGLPMMVTVSLAMNMMKMAKENCLIRKLVASETIGSATVICTDKTGTLTQNRMSVAWLNLGMTEYEADTLGTIVQNPQWQLLVESIAINSGASLAFEESTGGFGYAEPKLPPNDCTGFGFGITEPSSVRISVGIGNPTECALLRLLHDGGVDYRELRNAFPRLRELSHNSARKLSLVLVDKGEKKTCFVKGAPDRLLAHCSQVFVNNQREEITLYREKIEAALHSATQRALRVIAFIVKDGDGKCFDEAHDELCLNCAGHTLLALIGIADPIRPEIKEAVQTCKDAHVEVKMITGDAEPTAIAIAKQAGILSAEFNINAGASTGGFGYAEPKSPPNDCTGFGFGITEPSSSSNEKEIAHGELVLTSAELAALDDEQLLRALPALKVLARSTPMDKLRLVKAMHRQGKVVAMTGDGTNDAPALKFADVGISMGITGTEVAKEASDIVLIDDNFKSIVTGIWWGRTLYQNIQRFLQFQLSVNVVALSCALLGPLVGIPLPLTVTQLLWINIIMDTFAAIAMSTDPPRKKTMTREPIPRDASIITPSMGISILLNSFYQVAILFAALYCGWFLTAENRFDFHADPMGRGGNLQALTVFFTIFVMFQFWHKFNCRSLRHDESPFELLTKNKLFIVIVVTITLLQIVMVQASDWCGIGQIFRTIALSWQQWLAISLLTATILPVAWLVRQVTRLLEQSSAE